MNVNDNGDVNWVNVSDSDGKEENKILGMVARVKRITLIITAIIMMIINEMILLVIMKNKVTIVIRMLSIIIFIMIFKNRKIVNRYEHDNNDKVDSIMMIILIVNSDQTHNDVYKQLKCWWY